MMLEDRHLLWDDAWKFTDVVAKCEETMKSFKGNVAFWLDEREDRENYLALLGLEYGINPGWLFTSAQRERSLAEQDGTVKSFDYAFGVVGQDGPGTIEPVWNGFGSQAMRCARITAWHLGNNWVPRRPGLEPSSLQRWAPAGSNKVEMLDAEGGWRICASRAEFAQLRFTPHVEVLEKNAVIYARECPLFL